MSTILGGLLILAAGVGVVYFGYTLAIEIIAKVRQRKNDKNAGKK